MANINLLVGSVTGRAQRAAEAIAKVLKEYDHVANVIMNPVLEDATNPDVDTLIFVTSTTGQGEIPHTLVPLYVALQDQFPMLTSKRVAVVALGDSSYTTFCQAGNLIEELIFELQGQAFCERLNIDATENFDPVDVASKWALHCVSNL